MTAPDTAPAARPATLVWAVRLLLAEAAGLAALTLYLVVQDITADAHDLTVAIALTVFAALGAAAVTALARALGRAAVGARAPAIVIQMMVMVVGYYMITGGLRWLGIPLVALGLSVGVLLVLPPTTRALGLH